MADRKRFSEREVIETLHYCGIDVLCYRCKKKLEPSQKIEREHITELALGGADAPENCAYSHKACHAIATNGTKATSAGSSKQRIAKVNRLRNPKKSRCPLRSGKKNWPKGRKIQSRSFKRMDGTTVRREK